MLDKTESNWHRTQPKHFFPRRASNKIGLAEGFYTGILSANRLKIY
jgi:hypothetical protein